MNAKEALLGMANLADIIRACNFRLNRSLMLASAFHASKKDLALAIAICDDITGKDLGDALEAKKAT